MAIDRPTVSLAIPLALLLVCGSSTLVAQVDTGPLPVVGIEGRLLLDSEVPAQRLELLVAEDSDVGMLFFGKPLARTPIGKEGHYRADLVSRRGVADSAEEPVHGSAGRAAGRSALRAGR